MREDRTDVKDESRRHLGDFCPGDELAAIWGEFSSGCGALHFKRQTFQRHLDLPGDSVALSVD
jgi:hypothetical protein